MMSVFGLSLRSVNAYKARLKCGRSKIQFFELKYPIPDGTNEKWPCGLHGWTFEGNQQLRRGIMGARNELESSKS